MKAYIYPLLVMNLVSLSAHADTSSATGDEVIWDALTNVPIEQLPTPPAFIIGEKKQVGRLYCSHLQQIGQAITFNCSLMLPAANADDSAIWGALPGVQIQQLPSTPDFVIAEQKQVGRLSCSHLQQSGQPEAFNCTLQGQASTIVYFF